MRRAALRDLVSLRHAKLLRIVDVLWGWKRARQVLNIYTYIYMGVEEGPTGADYYYYYFGVEEGPTGADPHFVTWS